VSYPTLNQMLRNKQTTPRQMAYCG